MARKLPGQGVGSHSDHLSAGRMRLLLTESLRPGHASGAGLRSAQGSQAHRGPATPMEPHQGMPSASNQLPLSPGRGWEDVFSGPSFPSHRKDAEDKEGRQTLQEPVPRANDLREACGVP